MDGKPEDSIHNVLCDGRRGKAFLKLGDSGIRCYFFWSFNDPLMEAKVLFCYAQLLCPLHLFFAHLSHES